MLGGEGDSQGWVAEPDQGFGREGRRARLSEVKAAEQKILDEGRGLGETPSASQQAGVQCEMASACLSDGAVKATGVVRTRAGNWGIQGKREKGRKVKGPRRPSYIGGDEQAGSCSRSGEGKTNPLSWLRPCQHPSKMHQMSTLQPSGRTRASAFGAASQPVRLAQADSRPRAVPLRVPAAAMHRTRIGKPQTSDAGRC